MPKLPGQHIKPKYYVPIEDQLNVIFYEMLFKPLLDVAFDFNAQVNVGVRALTNAGDNPLQVAIRTGRVQYTAGVYSGQFNAAISRTLDTIGAKYDQKTKVYRQEPINVPGWVKAEAASYQTTARGAHAALMRTLDQIQTNLPKSVEDANVRPGRSLRAIQKDFESAVSAITVMPELTPEAKARLAADYNQNMKIYIDKFSKRMITSLRKTVEKNALEGYRFDSLIDGIKSKYSVSQNKAKFLARQETALFTAKYRAQRFGDAGVKRYTWRTSEDSRVRPAPGVKDRGDNHRVLNGKIFEYAHPPIVDSSNGRRANPGQDFNCRCIDEPLLE